MRRIHERFERSPRKSTRRASRELGIPQPTVWRVLRRRLLFKPYRPKPVQVLRLNNKRKRVEFCDRTLQNVEDDTSLPRLIVSDEATSHLSGKVNRHNVRIWGLQKIPKKHWNMRGTPRNLMCFVLYREGLCTVLFFLPKKQLLG